MSSITLKNVCLDYIVKTGSESIKKTAINLIDKHFRKSPAPRAIYNTSYRALNNLNLEINKGDRVGILGRNGAGKSTLLRVLAKVYKPSFGDIKVIGRISSLFDINLGMNPEATGYENIANLAIMRGMPRKDAIKLIPDIEKFTELGEFLNNPIRTYSTGMQMKLAFAVATTGSSDIMLIDEIIGAGDIHFMAKATQRLEKSIQDSHILVLTSHSNDIMMRFCNKALVLNKGNIEFLGDIKQGIKFYQNMAF